MTTISFGETKLKCVLPQDPLLLVDQIPTSPESDNKKKLKTFTVQIQVERFSLAMGRLLIIGKNDNTMVMAYNKRLFAENEWIDKNNIVPESFVTRANQTSCNMFIIGQMYIPVKVKRVKPFKVKLENAFLCRYDPKIQTHRAFKFLRKINIVCTINDTLGQQNPKV